LPSGSMPSDRESSFIRLAGAPIHAIGVGTGAGPEPIPLRSSAQAERCPIITIASISQRRTTVRKDGAETRWSARRFRLKPAALEEPKREKKIAQLAAAERRELEVVGGVVRPSRSERPGSVAVVG
jgi:hypothetical protein